MANDEVVLTNRRSSRVARYDWGEITTEGGSHGHELHSHDKEDEIIFVVAGSGICRPNTMRSAVFRVSSIAAD
jgi:oxalate decarboxylase/phosphoglucose isomerase-like protein (cupin superfamily)